MLFFLLDSLHSVPVAQMGNYQEYLKMMPSPLREIDPDQPKRLHTFGNPFKQDKKVQIDPVMQLICAVLSAMLKYSPPDFSRFCCFTTWNFNGILGGL